MKFKRLTALVLCALMLTGIFSVSAQAAQKTNIGMIDVKVSDNAQYVSQRSQVLEDIYQGIIDHEEAINIYSYGINSSEFQALGNALVDVYPELFFVSGYLGASSNGIIKTIKPQYSVDKTPADTMLGEFYAKADEYLAMVDNTMDDFTIALVLHDALALNNEYSIYNPDGSGEYSSNYSFMVKGWGRCENYAECYAYLLAQLGIKSEIVNSASMKHEWMKICLGGDEYYYNVDLTWDDPLVNNEDRPGKVAHIYFLLSDEQFRTANALEQRDIHYNYETLHVTDNKYDNYSTLHTLDNPLFYINGEFYTLYTKNDKGYIATYDYATDELTDKYEISDIWHTEDGGYWLGNFSGIGERDGLLYFNGENTVYVYNPAENDASVLMSGVLTDGNQLYGLYMKNRKIIGLEAADANAATAEVDLLREITYKYNVYDEAAQQTVEQSVNKVVRVDGMNDDTLVETNKPFIKSAYLEYGNTAINADGGIITAQISDSEKKFTVKLNGTEVGKFSYLETAKVGTGEQKSFMIDGKVVYVGAFYNFYVCSDTDVTTGDPTDMAEYALINLNNVTVTDDKVELDMLATANVGEGTYQRMGVALALSEKSKTDIQNAVETIDTGSGTSDKIFVHNSKVDYANQSGQYQFRYAPYFAKDKAKDRTIYFYTYVVTDNGVKVSTAATYDMSNLLA